MQLAQAVALNPGQLISNSSIDGPIFTYAFSHFMKITEGNWIALAALVFWVVTFVFYSRSLIKEKRDDMAALAAADADSE